jgi:hypothetical protein
MLEDNPRPKTITLTSLECFFLLFENVVVASGVECRMFALRLYCKHNFKARLDLFMRFFLMYNCGRFSDVECYHKCGNNKVSKEF